MSDRWAALISLPLEKRKQLEAVLESLGLSVHCREWERQTRTEPAGMPVLAVAPLEDYGQKHTLLTWTRPNVKRPPTALVGSGGLTPEILRFQLLHDVLNIVPESLWDDPLCLERTMRGLLFPEEMFNIRRFVPDATVVERLTIINLAEKHQIADEVASLVRVFAGTQHRTHDIRLIINELINNAFFHSFQNPEGEEKYTPRRFAQLEEGDRVALEVALSEKAVALAVEDNCGTISPREVLKYLLRQTSGEGVYDSHGRGFYLVSNLADHLSVCVKPGQRTRVTVMNHAGTEGHTRTLNFFVVGE